MQTVPIKRILVLVFGATTGATLYEFRVGQGFRFVWNKEIPWVMNDQIYIWPMDWLKNIIHEVKEMATPGTIIAPAMWGADVVHIENNEIVEPVFHYRSVPSDFASKKIANSGIAKYEWSRLMGNVHPEFWQMAFLSSFWRQEACKYRRYQVIPLADWITKELSGGRGHDPVMLHNQGVGVATSKLVNLFFNRTDMSEFAPVWRTFDQNELLALPNGVYVMPCTHDSALARLIFTSTNSNWGLWTGSWYGVYRAVTEGDGITPSEKTYAAGLVFEAMPGGISAISNIGMDGPKYKALKNVRGPMGYAEAAELALANLPEAIDQSLMFSEEILCLEPSAFAVAALTEAMGDLHLALAMMVNTIAIQSKKGLNAAAMALGIPSPCEVAIVGGFAENTAILRTLKYHGINPIIPPFARMATHAGAAAQALVASGTAKTIKEAIEMLPNKMLA